MRPCLPASRQRSPVGVDQCVLPVRAALEDRLDEPVQGLLEPGGRSIAGSLVPQHLRVVAAGLSDVLPVEEEEGDVFVFGAGLKQLVDGLSAQF